MIRLKYQARKEMLFALMLLPSLLGLLVFFIAPFLLSAQMMVVDNPVGRNFVGLFHFFATLGNAAFQLAIRNTIVFMLMSVPLNMVFALLIAMMLRRMSGIGKGILGAFFLLPLVIPSGSVVHFWQSLFGLNGFLNGLLNNEPTNWLNQDFSIIFIVIIFLWKNVGFNIVLFLAGLNLIPKDYYDNAATCGAGKVRQFFMITLVYLMPTTFMTLLLSIVQSFQAFREIFLLTGPFPHPSLYMLQHYLNNQFAALDYQRMVAAAYILTLGIVAIVLVMLYVQRRVMNYD
ncbi:MAG: sugar ABC transporter permease [Oscillospiraceae bacterium]|nr:sugar ABC transporter permease [Oscillospiraceae bacterium]